MTSQAPLAVTDGATIPATAATDDYDQDVAEAPWNGTVTALAYTPEAAIVGAASPATRTLSAINKGAAGAGTAVVASLALTSGTLTAFTPAALTVDSARNSVSAGDVIVFVSTHGGTTGLADPGGHADVTFTRG